MTDPREVLDEIQQRADKATGMSWDMSGPLLLGRTGQFDWRIVATDIGSPDDAQFIARSRTDVPKLVAALRAVLDAEDVPACPPRSQVMEAWLKGYAFARKEALKAITDALEAGS